MAFECLSQTRNEGPYSGLLAAAMRGVPTKQVKGKVVEGGGSEAIVRVLAGKSLALLSSAD